MTVRSINASAACAGTMAKLDPSIPVARTGESTMLLNLPRDILIRRPSPASPACAAAWASCSTNGMPRWQRYEMAMRERHPRFGSLKETKGLWPSPIHDRSCPSEPTEHDRS